MSSKSEFDPNATPWRPKGFKNLNSAGRSEMRSQKMVIQAKQNLAREKAREARKAEKAASEGRSRVEMALDEAATIQSTEKI